MAATDVPPSRLTEAKAKVLEALHDLPANGTVSVIAAGRTARVVVNGTSDLGRVRAAIDGITVSPSTGDLGDALNLANALAARAGDAEILVATDAALAIKPTTRLDHKVKVLQVGRERRNQAIVALAVRPAPSGVTRSVFVSVANLDIEPAQRRLELYGDGILIEARDLQTLDPQTRTEVIVDDVPRAVSAIEVRLTSGTAGANGGGGATAGDALPLDDRAWAIVPPDRLRRMLVVGEGDPYLETALSYLPSTELYGVAPAKYGPEYPPRAVRPRHLRGLPPGDPAACGRAGDRADGLERPRRGHRIADGSRDRDAVTGRADAKYVDLSSVHIGKAAKLSQPAWARTIIPGPGGAPLLYVGSAMGSVRRCSRSCRGTPTCRSRSPSRC